MTKKLIKNSDNKNNMKIKYIIFVLAFSLISLCASAQLLVSRAIIPPQGIFPYNCQFNKEKPFADCLLIAPFKLNLKDSAKVFTPKPTILDGKGYVAWYCDKASGKFNSGFAYFPEVRRLGWMNVADDGSIVYILMDTSFQVIDSLRNTASVLGDAHEFQVLANGHMLIGGKRFKTYDLDAQKFVDEAPDGKRKVKAVGYVIQEFDAQKRLLFEWDSNEHINAQDFVESYGMNLNEFDYCHGNAITLDERGDFWVSFRNFDAVYKINRATKRVDWILGGKSNQFKFLNDQGFSGQHYVRLLPNGNLSLFDNATNTQPQISRGVEYRLDTVNKTVSKVSAYSTGVFGKSLGSYHNFADQYHLLNYGFVFNPAPNISLLDSAQELILNLTFQDSVMNYRAQIADVSRFIQRPLITATRLSEGMELSAPEGCAAYLWSNGERSRKIIVKENGTYQVWTPQGIGMAGSLPFELRLTAK